MSTYEGGILGALKAYQESRCNSEALPPSPYQKWMNQFLQAAPDPGPLSAHDGEEFGEGWTVFRKENGDFHSAVGPESLKTIMEYGKKSGL